MKQVVLYAALLSAAMVGAYISWTSDVAPKAAGASQEEVAVYTARAGDVKKLAFDSEKLKVAVERKTDPKGEYVWVTIEETKEKPAPPKPPPVVDPEDAPDGEEGPELAPEPEPEPILEVTRTAFLGNDASDGLFTSFEPLTALRDLDPEGADLDVFGLNPAEATIQVARSSGELSIELGGETYGSKDRYARYNNRLMLLEDTTVRPLQFAGTRLVERRLHPLVQNEIDTAVVQRNGQSLGLVQRNKDDRQAAFWARKGDEDSKDDVAATWLDKLLRLKAQSYPDDVDLSGATESFSVQLTSGSTTWGFSVLQLPEGDTLYARSEFNRGVVELTASLANEAIADLDELFQD